MLDCVVFTIPCLLFLEVQMVGRLFGSEVLMLALFPFVLLFRGKALSALAARTLLILGLLWLASQVATDLIRETSFRDYSRGWSKIGFTMINFATLYMLLHDSSRRVLIFAVGLGIGLVLDHFISPGELAAKDPWKFGLGLPLTLLMVLGAQHVFARSNHLAVPAALCVMAVIHFVMGFRSLGGITLLNRRGLVLSVASRAAPFLGLTRQTRAIRHIGAYPCSGLDRGLWLCGEDRHARVL